MTNGDKMEEQKKRENPKMVRDWSTGKWMTEDEWWELEMVGPGWFWPVFFIGILVVGILHDACR